MESRETMATRNAIWLEEKEGTADLSRTHMEPHEAMTTRDATWLKEKEKPASLSRTTELMWKDFRRLTDAMLGLISATESGYGKVLGERPSWRAVSETAPICCWIAVC